MQSQSNELSFNGKDVYVGFDVHAKSWKVTIIVDTMYHKTFVQQPDANILYSYLVKHFPDANYKTVYEAGFSGFQDHYKLKEFGVDSIVVNPSDVPTTGKEMIQKEDKRDSYKLARSLSAGQLTGIYIPSQETINDRLLIRTRAMVVKDLTRYKNRIKAFLYFMGIKYPEEFFNSKTHWSSRFLKWLKELQLPSDTSRKSLDALLSQVDHLRLSLLQINKDIKELAKSEKYRENVRLLRTIGGIGFIFSITIMVELDDITRFKNNEKFFSYLGVIPSSHSSGEKTSIGKITPRSHSVLRKLLIEAAWVAVRQDPVLMRKHLQNCNRMNANKSIIHIARALASRIRFVLLNQKEYKSI